MDGNSPNANLKRAHAKLVQLKDEVDFHMRALLSDIENASQKDSDAVVPQTADTSLLETLKQLANDFLECSAASLPHKEYPYISCLSYTNIILYSLMHYVFFFTACFHLDHYRASVLIYFFHLLITLLV